MSYIIKDYLKIMQPGDKVYITYINKNGEVEYDEHLLLYTHPEGDFSLSACKKAFESRMSELTEQLEGRQKYILTIEYTLTRVKTYEMDRGPISWEEFLSSEIIYLKQKLTRKKGADTIHTDMQIASWICRRCVNHRILDL